MPLSRWIRELTLRAKKLDLVIPNKAGFLEVDVVLSLTDVVSVLSLTDPDNNNDDNRNGDIN